VDLRDFPNPSGLLPGGEALRRRTHQITANASGVREYMPGDSLNRIHWASTARRNRLIAKEFELDPLAEVWIFVDAERSSQAAFPATIQQTDIFHFWRKQQKVTLAPSTEEYAVSIAASLGRYFLRRGRAVGLLGVGRHFTLIPPDRGGRQLGKVLEALALMRAEGTLPLGGLMETQARHIPRGSTVILITPTVREEFVYDVEYLLRRGLRPVAVLLNTATFGGPEGSVKLAERLRAFGVQVRLIDNGADLEKALTEDRREKISLSLS
jgi:uncharacterized protein (DUF58 family)